MTFSFKGPTPGLACAWTIHFKRCQCEDFGSHTVLWLISHFYFLLYDVFAIRLLSVIFFFQYFFARVWSFLTCNCFLKKGKQADEQSLKKGLFVLMFNKPRTCSQFFDMMMSHTPGNLLVYASGCRSQRKCIAQSSSAGYSTNTVLVWNQIFLTLKVISERQ